MSNDWFKAFNEIVVRSDELRIGMDIALDAFLNNHEKRARKGVLHLRRRQPRLHPTKGYRGAHKLFRGGSR